MSLEEPIDEITATGKFLATGTRREIHAKGLWHQVFHCLIIRPGPSPTVILQRRSDTARSFPGRLDLSATGHLLAGEAPLDGLRELNEELGVELEADDLTYLGRRLLADDSGEQSNRELVNVYFVADERPLTEYRPGPTEVQSLVEVGIDGLLETLTGQSNQTRAKEWTPTARANGLKAAAQQILDVTISREDLVDQVDGYWQVLMIMAARFANGVTPIAI